MVDTAEKIRRLCNMEEILDPELEDVEDFVWREQAIEIGRNFFIVYGALALVRDIARFVCRK